MQHSARRRSQETKFLFSLNRGEAAAVAPRDRDASLVFIDFVGLKCNFVVL
jgi:hypothetical protein